jgi:hypothetical protein
MNVLDENMPETQRALPGNRHLAARRIGQDVGRDGMADTEVISLLHGLHQPTFFTLDRHYYKPSLCHKRYCLVFLDVPMR